MVDGNNFRELTLLRLDGECWEGDPESTVNVNVERGPEFKNWDDWKEYNKQGYDCTVYITREAGRIYIRTTNRGIAINNTTILRSDISPIYVALSGDQCAVTNIRIKE